MNGKPGFIEDFHNGHEDPHGGESYDFDWVGLEARLGEAAEELPERDYAALVFAFNLILDWLLDVPSGDKEISDKRIGRRTVALAYILNPARFEGQAMSRIAARLGLHKATFGI